MVHTYKLALITGATSGIGEEYARQLPESTDLILTGRNTEKLKELASELGSKTRKVETIPADLATSEGLAALAGRVKSKPIDLFINNAGLGYYGAFESHTPSQESSMIQVNVVAVAALAHALCPQMAKQAAESGGKAAMVIVSSVAGFMALPWFATYSATKMFDLALAEALAEEYKHTPLAIQALCPGPTRTNFGKRAGVPADRGPDKSAMDVTDVVALSLKKLGKKRVVVPGILNKLTVIFPKILPRAFVTRLGGFVVKRTKQM